LFYKMTEKEESLNEVHDIGTYDSLISIIVFISVLFQILLSSK